MNYTNNINVTFVCDLKLINTHTFAWPTVIVELKLRARAKVWQYAPSLLQFVVH